MDVTEEALLDAIRRVLSGAGPEVRVGVGDDAAVVAPGTGELVLTTDALVEGTHFTLDTTSARDLGAKAIAVNVSDIAAMAASPRYALCALTLSPAVDAGWVMELLGGMRDGMRRVRAVARGRQPGARFRRERDRDGRGRGGAGARARPARARPPASGSSSPATSAARPSGSASPARRVA